MQANADVVTLIVECSGGVEEELCAGGGAARLVGASDRSGDEHGALRRVVGADVVEAHVANNLDVLGVQPEVGCEHLGLVAGLRGGAHEPRADVVGELGALRVEVGERAGDDRDVGQRLHHGGWPLSRTVHDEEVGAPFVGLVQGDDLDAVVGFMLEVRRDECDAPALLIDVVHHLLDVVRTVRLIRGDEDVDLVVVCVRRWRHHSADGKDERDDADERAAGDVHGNS